MGARRWVRSGADVVLKWPKRWRDRAGAVRLARMARRKRAVWIPNRRFDLKTMKREFGDQRLT